ncbi:uncharacterized protein K460DRAFT_194232 [Cucurbitaria berberidis CBS 394.84]|uniref:C3H1-type domain-containing protein n=1 Tax=Cucurbitaria berberidis CBS 394.84 TaxID=1168544 RepID=A0A9P4G895_9PLEO|nr:uncharacterized protein K460DRAFT_194232 [Cucurbitaria berberidis CBS 394.84]KAF1840898.1 hypothetical protein K460DRAFT_194232 [Cucurbitaria berberidis CBS 394.84]
MVGRSGGSGRSQRGDHGRGGRGEGNQSQNRTICFTFRDTGECDRANCRFSHNLSSTAGAQQTGRRAAATMRTHETEEQKQARASYNNWKKLIGTNYAPGDTYNMKRLWKGAVAILQEDDRDWKQQLPRDLDDSTATCNGRAHIKAILDQRTTASESETFVEIAKDFLKVITHPSLLDCLAVDTYVGGVYNFISGVNGDRAISFFQHLCETLVTVKTEDASSAEQKTLEQTLIGLSTALYEVLRRDQRARLNERLEALIQSLKSASEIIPSALPSITSTIVNKDLIVMRAMIARAKGLVAEDNPQDDAPTTTRITTTLYPRDLVIPQGRQDNDNVDITEIVIFPTREEIMSDAKECLPSTDPDQPHFIANQVGRHIDTNFRLFRHDIFGDLKKALAGLMHAATEDPDRLSNPRINLGDVRVYNYTNARVSYIAFDHRRGLEVQISFLQPPQVRGRSAAERRAWWEDSRRLDQGSLLSFIWIQDSIVEHLFLTVSKRSTGVDEEYGLTQHDTMATITTKLSTQNSQTIQALLQSSFQKSQGVLLEFPSVIPATFVPILESLQSMQRLSRLPFHQWILPDQHNGSPGLKVYHEIPAPLYARRPGFTFPLRAIMKTKSDTLAIEHTSSCDDAVLIEEIMAKTELDRGQCRALIAALTREFAFIQGPPGTGKSYLGLQVMKILLDIRDKAKLGPIIVVCYTNHALDQFLEHLLEAGVRKIIRVGGQSKSELLQGYNLRDVTRTEVKTKSEAWQSAMAYQTLQDLARQARATLGRLHHSKQAEWEQLGNHIQEKYPRIYKQFEREDDEGFTTVGRHPFDIWMLRKGADGNHASIASQDVGRLLKQATGNVHSLTYVERCALVRLWVDEVRFEDVTQLSTTASEAADTQAKLNNIHDETDRRVLEGAKVIGVTTSGLAKRISVLQHVRCKVIICEEAGEVMEPHMLSALLPTVEHCIQIGDHEQLRPSVNNFKELSLESTQGALHKLDRSQFERLSIGERGRPLMPVAQLEVQRRMRPDFSRLIRETIYPRLIDHPSTAKLPDVVGMRKNLFWLDHRNLEDGKDSDIHHSKSKSNPWEVDIVHALVRHIVRQGVYNSKEIAVLTPYTGQLQKIRTAMRNDFEIVLSERDQDALEKDGFGVAAPSFKIGEPTKQQHNRRKPLERKAFSDLLRVATVNNFQGEEAKIIIVSLVRSNNKEKVGFLKTSNRINVLLSRAQHSMYLIRNTETYASVAMWQKVIAMLRTSDSVRETLGLCCPKHPKKIIQVQEPDDFYQLSPKGGCQEACTERLTDCSHQCQAKCHSSAMHDVFKCKKPCQRRHQPCDHPCQKPTCGEDCDVCMVNISTVQLPCGHNKNNVSCYKTLDLESIVCVINVSKRVPGCQHNVEVMCSSDVTKAGFKCPSPCPAILPCGHPCPGTCGQCNKKIRDGQPILKHLSCTVVCGRKFGTCNHTCRRECHDGTDCGLCQSFCEVRCKHSQCMQRCHEPCTPCVEKCTWSCEHHGDCTMPCSAPCNRLPCDERCTKLLPCGDQCPSICGEDCPVDYCQECDMKLDEVPDLILETRYSDINLDESPIVVLGCRHFFTVETLDGMIGLKEVYDIDTKTGLFAALKENAQLAAAVPKCPTCRCPIQQFVTQRYNRLINRAVIDEMSKRFIVSGQQELQELENKLKTLESGLEKSRKSLVPSTVGESKVEARSGKNINGKISSRYGEAIFLTNALKNFQRRMNIQHQPAHKLHQATVHVITRNHSLDAALAALNLESSATSANRGHGQRITFGSYLLEIKTRCLVLEDKFEISRAAQSKAPNNAITLSFPGGPLIKQAEDFLPECIKLIDGCNDNNFPKIAVEATLYYARIAGLCTSLSVEDRDKGGNHREAAHVLLEKAAKLCEQPFQGADVLEKAVEQAARLLGKEWYEKVSDEEIKAIKKAMVSGSRGIATHSGHWYNCVNGHPVRFPLIAVIFPR